jgi:hypothetical protein
MDNIILQKLDEGQLFYYKDVIDFSSPSPESKIILMQTPLHPITVYMQCKFSANTEFGIGIFEGVTYSSIGTEIDVCNCDFNCDTCPETKLYSDPVGVTGGVNKWPARISARPATPLIDSPITSQPTAEMPTPVKCKPDTTYSFNFDKINGGDGYMDIDIWWYEHSVK